MTNPYRISVAFVLVVIVATGWLHLGTLLLSILFSCFALTKFNFLKPPKKWLAVTLFLGMLAAVSYALAYFIHETVRALPDIAERAVPAIIQWATDHQITLPFADFDSLKQLAFQTARDEASNIGKFADFARGATEHFIYMLAGCIVAIGLFLNPRIEMDHERSLVKNNLYSLCCAEITRRCAMFFESFAMVMNAQVSISAINTVLTGIFVLAFGLQQFVVAVGMTFLCGFIPVVGNLLSNAIVVALGFMVSPTKGLCALVFLVVVHKLEYFLNSKIIGEKIRCPIWLTLVGLLIGERLMGITGMVLSPVVLHYIRIEASKIPTEKPHHA